MMGNYVGFLLTALLLVSCMRSSEQTDRQPQRRNNGNNDRPAGRGRPPRPTSAVLWTPELDRALMRIVDSEMQGERGHRRRLTPENIALMGLQYGIPQQQILRRIQQLAPRREREMRISGRQPDIIWNPTLESQLLQLYRHDEEINRDPTRLHRRWRELHPALPDIGQRRLYDKTLRLHNHPANQMGGQNREPDVTSNNDSAPGTPSSETGSEIAWDDFHTALSRLRGESGYESDGAESSGSIPPYPESPRARSPR